MVKGERLYLVNPPFIKFVINFLDVDEFVVNSFGNQTVHACFEINI
jgi:hypothetical protein